MGFLGPSEWRCIPERDYAAFRHYKILFGAESKPVTSESMNNAENQTPESSSQEQSDTKNASLNSEQAGVDASRSRILIGSQRDPDAYRPKPKQDWTPTAEPDSVASEDKKEAAPGDSLPAKIDRKPSQERLTLSEAALNEMIDEPAPLPALPEGAKLPATPGRIPPPNIRDRLSPELEAELEQALGGASLDDLLTGGSSNTSRADEAQIEADSKRSATVIALRKDDVFVELGSREQGVVPISQFSTAPKIGDVVKVVVQKFNPDDGLYELSLPNMSVKVEDWSDLTAGTLVEAKVTGHNTGGLECTVNNIRGFIPMSHIALFRVENAADFVGQTFTCLVTEANPERGNLILSRRSILEREKEQVRKQTLDSLQPGAVCEGLVRKIMDFGAFVDLGGVDGLVHISQLGWGRVRHPSDVLAEGQKIKVRIEKVDPETGKISLAYRDLMDSPWTMVERKYPPQSIIHGKVVRIMDFGAFVELEPGVEGLVHISQLSHKRVFRVSDAVQEGQEVDAVVQSIDVGAQRISLSIKALSQPEPTKKEKEAAERAAQEEAAAAESVKPKSNKPSKPLKGGLGGSTGSQFGLKW